MKGIFSFFIKVGFSILSKTVYTRGHQSSHPCQINHLFTLIYNSQLLKDLGQSTCLG